MANSKSYLAANPTIDVVFETTDGTLFFDKSSATNHAKTLSDTKVTETRHDETPSLDKEVTEEDKALAAATGDVATEDAATTPAATEPVTTEPATTEEAATEVATKESPVVPVAKAAKNK
jgi:hypothetical protein